MRTVNSPSLQTVTRADDEKAFFAWLEFYRRNGVFKALEKAARSGSVNVVSVFSEWPPTHPGEYQDFERRWYDYHIADAGAKDLADQERVRKKHALSNHPSYSPARSHYSAWGKAA